MKFLKAIFIVAVAAGCAIEDPGYSVFLGNNLAPSLPPTCQYTPSSTVFIPFGTLDLAVRRGYIFAPVITNQMKSVTTDGVGFANEEEVRADANTYALDGFYTTYEVRDVEPVATPGKDGADIGGAAHAFIGATGSPVPAGGQVSTAVDILPASILDQLTTDNTPPFRVYIHVKGSGRTQDGRVLGTNEELYMVDICSGCLSTCAVGKVQDLTSVCQYGQDQADACITPP